MMGKTSKFLRQDQRPYSIENGNHHHADVRKNSQPHVGKPQCTEDQAQHLDADGKADIFIDNAHALPGDTDRKRDLFRVVIHQDDVCRLNCRVRPHRPHGNADVGTGKDRGVIDPVSYKGQDRGRVFLRQECFYSSYLFRGKQFCMDSQALQQQFFRPFPYHR